MYYNDSKTSTPGTNVPLGTDCFRSAFPPLSTKFTYCAAAVTPDLITPNATAIVTKCCNGTLTAVPDCGWQCVNNYITVAEMLSNFEACIDSGTKGEPVYPTQFTDKLMPNRTTLCFANGASDMRN